MRLKYPEGMVRKPRKESQGLFIEIQTKRLEKTIYLKEKSSEELKTGKKNILGNSMKDEIRRKGEDSASKISNSPIKRY